MRKGVVPLIAGLLVLGALLGAAGHVPIVSAKTTVKYVDVKDNPVAEGEFSYGPKKLTIRVGTKVTWRNKSSQPHSVTDTATHPRFDSGDVDHLIGTGQKWSHVFRKTGTYTYYCITHSDMTGKVVVTK